MSRRPILASPMLPRALRWLGTAAAAVTLAACGGGGGGTGTVNAPAPPAAVQCPSTLPPADAGGFSVGVCVNANAAGEGITTVRRNVAVTVTDFPNPQTTPTVALMPNPALGALPGAWAASVLSALGNLNGVFAQSSPFVANDYYAIGDVSRARLITATNPPVVTTGAAYGTAPQTDLQFVQLGTWERFVPNGSGPLTGYYGSWLRGTVSPAGTAPAESYVGRFVGIYASAVQRCSVAATAQVTVADAAVTVTLSDFFSNGTQCNSRPIAFQLSPAGPLTISTATLAGGVRTASTFATPSGATELAGAFYGSAAKEEVAGQLIAPITVQVVTSTGTSTINATIVGAFGAK